MSFGNFGSKPMKTPKAPKAPGKKPFSSRTVIGVICIVLALLITFGVAPLVNRFTDQKVDIVRLKADVPRGQIITADHLEIVNVGSYNLPNNVIKDGKAVVGKYAATDLYTGDYLFANKLSTDTLSSTKPTRTGYTFQGWSTSSSATSASYSAGGTFSTNANTTLYAVWAKNKYTISFNANGGSGAPSSQTKTYGLDLTLSSTKPTRSGYTFKGWGTSSSSTTASYQPGGKYTSNSSATLYAVWESNAPTTYTVSYNAHGGSGAPASQTKTHGVTLTLSSTKPTRSGYSFLGWSTSSSAKTA